MVIDKLRTIQTESFIVLLLSRSSVLQVPHSFSLLDRGGSPVALQPLSEIVRVWQQIKFREELLESALCDGKREVLLNIQLAAAR